MCRNSPSRPVSDILSSQVTKEIGTSPDTAAQLTFRYSVDVSLIMHTYKRPHNCDIDFTRMIILQ